MTRRWIPIAVLLLMGAALPATAFAQADAGCPMPERMDGPLEVFPADGASGVALNEPLRVRYSPGSLAAFEGSPATLLTITNSDTGDSISGATSVLGDTLAFVPTTGWPANAVVVGIARGVDADLNVQFITGSSVDENAPEIGPGLTMESSEVAASCTTPDGFRIDVTFPRASDVDGARGDIEYLLFLTRAPDLEVPVFVGRTRNFASDEITMAFVLDREMVTGNLCAAVVAVDGAGHMSSSDEVCGNPLEGAFFEPLCSTSAAGASKFSATWAALALLVAGFAYVRVRRRAR